MKLKMAAADKVCVKYLKEGLSALFLIDTRNAKESREIKSIFKDIETLIKVKQVCSGKLLGYAVMADDANISFIDEIEDVLKSKYSLILAQRSLDNITFHIVRELCSGIKGKLISLPHCNLCGKTIPFPAAELSICNDSGNTLVTRNYCTGCVSKFYSDNKNGLLKKLSRADGKILANLTRSNVVRKNALDMPTWYAVGPNAENTTVGISR